MGLVLQQPLLMNLKDPNMKGFIPNGAFDLFKDIALACVDLKHKRPTADKITQEFKNALRIQRIKEKEKKFRAWRFAVYHEEEEV
ncbi:hypothetical protein L2E82_42575 [Cichorium intybus]|uniref:Uncharacterized protein n=1 Tax=Cichorium intybus TaxID=13427 RepID=A0ACB8ZM12_CICIN|nr:hypothetical protein L2E82_42575 [Cichorium intybus]